jgi:hypothetical protein
MLSSIVHKYEQLTGGAKNNELRRIVNETLRGGVLPNEHDKRWESYNKLLRIFMKLKRSTLRALRRLEDKTQFDLMALIDLRRRVTIMTEEKEELEFEISIITQMRYMGGPDTIIADPTSIMGHRQWGDADAHAERLDELRTQLPGLREKLSRAEAEYATFMQDGASLVATICKRHAQMIKARQQVLANVPSDQFSHDFVMRPNIFDSRGMDFSWTNQLRDCGLVELDRNDTTSTITRQVQNVLVDPDNPGVE